MKKNNPLVSIIIVNWNGKNYLQSCLQSLSKITYKQVEIVIVDQNSSDGSVAFVQKKYPKAIIIENKENTGYVGGNNLGAAKAKGKYLLILNNDIEVDKHFLEPLVASFETDAKLGCCQPKAINLRYKGKLDGGGSFFTPTGFLYHKGYLENANKKEFNEEYYVYSVKGAYMMTRRELFKRIGGLDKDFFIYFEESDYCGRVWVAGYTVKYIPQSVVYHWGGSDTKQDWEQRFALVQYRSFKNRICSYIKNLSTSQLSLTLPLHVLLSEGISIYYLCNNQSKTFIAIQRAIFWNILHLEQTLEKRKKIQNTFRKATDKEIFQQVGIHAGFAYYLNAFKLLNKG